MQIKKIFLYSVPYTEDDRHQPLNSQMPQSWTPLKSFDNIKANLDTFGKVIALTALYDDVRNANYMKFEISINDVDENYYAWIDKISLDSQTKSGRILFYHHWDYWRTFIEKIKPLRGIVVQRKKLEFNPPQVVPRIIESYDFTEHDIIYQDKRIAWVYMTVLNKAKTIERIAFPVSRRSYFKKFQLNDLDNHYIDTPSFEEVINGSLLTAMGIESNKIMGCSVCSIPPAPYVFDVSNNKVTINYTSINTGFKTNIYTEDLIEFYDNELRAYDDKCKIWIAHIHQDPDDRLEILKNLKLWCYPRKEIIVQTSENYPIKFIPAEKQYFPFLMYLRHYTPDFSRIIEIQLFDQNRKAYIGECEWKKDQYILHGRVFVDLYQKFSLDTSQFITKIRINSENLDECELTFSGGGTKENVKISDVFLERTNEGESYEFIKMVEDSTEITCDKFDNNRIIVLTSVSGAWPPLFYNFERPLSSTPLSNLYLLDNAGYPISKFQQGRDLLSYRVQAISQNSEMFVLYRFNTGGYIENTEFVVNMTHVDLTQEYFNEYILSCEREAANQRRMENIVASLTNFAANTTIGTLIAGPGGGIVGGLKSIGKTLIAGGLTTGGVGTILGAYQQGRLENRLQDRGSMLIRGGGDYSWLLNGYLVSLVRTKIDEYSEEQYKSKVNIFGIDCNEIDGDGSDISSLLKSEGPLKLSSVTLDKDIPYEANVFIRQKLLDGVYLDSSLSVPANEPILLNKNN